MFLPDFGESVNEEKLVWEVVFEACWISVTDNVVSTRE